MPQVSVTHFSQCSHCNHCGHCSNCSHCSHPARALRALGLLPAADGAPIVGWGKTFWRVGQFFFFYKNCRFSETKSRKINPKVRNGPSFLGLQTVHWRNPGPKSKKWIFGPKSEILGFNNKNSLLEQNHVLVTTGQRQPNLAFLPNIGLFSPFDPMPDRKCEWDA